MYNTATVNKFQLLFSCWIVHKSV